MMSGPQSRQWVVYGALAANLGVCLAKFVAGAVSGSAALISEGIHSLADSGNELLLLLGLRRVDLPGAIQRLEGRIRDAHPEITRIFVEASSLSRS
jgi:divalent metal cation (Fe/Co/Zn/Cd) transporter